MSQMFQGTERFSSFPSRSPHEDESGPRKIRVPPLSDEPTRPVREEALRWLDQHKQAEDEREVARIKKELALPAEPTTVFSKVGLDARLEEYRARHLKDDRAEVRRAYTSAQSVEGIGTAPTLRPQAPTDESSIAAMGLAPTMAAPFRGEDREVSRVARRASPPPFPVEARAPFDAWIEGKVTDDRRPVAMPSFEAKLNRIARERFGKEFPKLNRPRVTVTGIEPPPILLTQEMRRSRLAPVEEIPDLTAFADLIEEESEEQPIPLVRRIEPRLSTYQKERQANLTPDKQELINRAYRELQEQRGIQYPTAEDDGFISLV